MFNEHLYLLRMIHVVIMFIIQNIRTVLFSNYFYSIIHTKKAHHIISWSVRYMFLNALIHSANILYKYGQCLFI